MDKQKLDEILESHKAQPVGNGYIDIIISRDGYKLFITDLIMNGFKIQGISWWEWCQNEEKSKYGMGGPRSNYYEGWFAELPIKIDDIDTPNDISSDNLIGEITKIIESKSITYPNEIMTFKQNTWLTPAIWLDVPDEWRNNHS